MALSDLLIQQTKDAIKSRLLTNLQTNGFPVNNWSETSAAKSILDAFADTLYAYAQQTPDIAGLGLIDYSSGAWLTEVAKNFGVLRNPSVKTTRILRITDTLGSITPSTCTPYSTWIRDNSGRKFVNPFSFTIPHLSYIDVPFEAEQGGSSYNSVSSGYSFINSKQGCVISEPVLNITTYGQDEELDQFLKARVLSKLNAIGDGLSESKFLVWMQAANTNVRTIKVIPGYYNSYTAPGCFNVYVSPTLTPTELTDLASALVLKLPAAMLVSVLNCTVHTVNVNGTIGVPATSLASASSAGLAALGNLQNSIPIGGLVDFQAVVASLLIGCNTSCVANITAPLSDLTLGTTETVNFNTAGLSYYAI